MNPAVKLIGSASHFFLQVTMTVIGIVGYLFTEMNWINKLILFLTAVLTIIPELVSSIIGVVLFSGIFFMQFFKASKEKSGIFLESKAE